MAYNIKLVRVFHNGMWHVAEFEDLEMPYMDTNQYKFCLNIKQLMERIDAGINGGFNVGVEVEALATIVAQGGTIQAYNEAREKMLQRKAA